MIEQNPLSAKAQYTKLSEERQPFLERARECARLTLPFLIPNEGDSGATNYRTPYQSVGSAGVNNLASKLLVSLFPPNSPFLRLAIDEFEYKNALPELGEGQSTDELKAQLEASLATVARAVMTEIETSSSRPTFYETIKHLLVAGNALLYLPKEGGLKVYHLNRFVVKRDPMGNVLDVIVKETVSPTVLPSNITSKITDSGDERKSVDLYTRIVRPSSNKDWESWQEVEDIMVAGSFGKFAKDKSPWIPLRFSKIDGQAYGRGHVEANLGDLQSLEGLQRAILEASALSAKVVVMVNPNGTTRKVDLQRAENGDIIDGVAEEVTMLQSAKSSDFKVTYQTAQDITRRLSKAFLLVDGIQRDAERVTAEEIRTLIQEIESSMGGTHALFAQDFQMPVAILYMERMQREKRLPQLPKNIVKPQIVTGIEAIGRGNDLQKLRATLGIATETLGPDVVARYIKPRTVLSKIFVGGGVDDEGFFKSEEEMQAEAQQAQQQAMIEKLGPPAINQMGGIVKGQAAAQG